ncbi:hypothetical protein H0H87_008609 [Tephrocybe sp. NHM501043]|nr:hypothetical protein H0H87_008609 [Tephrocybe sp. NHM501043]
MDETVDAAEWSNVIDFTGASDGHCPSAIAAAADNTQIPTPPLSHDGSLDDQDTLVSVSTTFYPGAHHQGALPDAILLSSDAVFFYIHSSLLLHVSTNSFHFLLPAQSPKQHDPIIDVQENSAILNIILHAIYDISCAHYSPSFPQLVAAVHRFQFYGVDPKSTILPNSPLYSLLLSHAPLYPLELYSLAANYDLHDLAVSTSSHLLSFPLSSLTDEMAQAMGPIYLKRLFFLHFGRSDALKRVLLSPPHPHPPTPCCDFSDQKKLTRAWALASAYLAWDARPGTKHVLFHHSSPNVSMLDLSTSTMESALRPLEDHLGCEDCKESLQTRIKTLVVQWSLVKVTPQFNSSSHLKRSFLTPAFNS